MPDMLPPSIPLPALVPVALAAAQNPTKDKLHFWRSRESIEQMAFLVKKTVQGVKEYKEDLLAVALAWPLVELPEVDFPHPEVELPTLEALWRQVEPHIDFLTLAMASNLCTHDTIRAYKCLKRQKIIYPDGTTHSGVREIAQRLAGTY